MIPSIAKTTRKSRNVCEQGLNIDLISRSVGGFRVQCTRGVAFLFKVRVCFIVYNFACLAHWKTTRMMTIQFQDCTIGYREYEVFTNCNYGIAFGSCMCI